MTPAGGPLFLLAVLGLLFGVLVLAGLLEAIARQERAARTGPAPSRDCGCAGCRGTADVAPRGR